MLAAFSRILQITIFAFVLIFVIVFSLRQLGKEQKFSSWSHPLLSSSTHSVKLWLPKQKSSFNKRDILYLSTFYDYKSLGWKVRLNKQNSLKLINFLKQLPKTKGLYLFVENEKGNAKELLSLIGQSFHDEQIIFEARSFHFLKEVKKMKPRWVYVASRTQFQQFQLLTSIFLETLARFEVDLVRLSPQELRHLPSRAVLELKKRHVKLAFNSDETTSPAALLVNKKSTKKNLQPQVLIFAKKL